MAQAKELKPATGPTSPNLPPRLNRTLLAIIAVAACWLLAMTGSIWWSPVPQAGWKASVLLGIGSLFFGGWALALWLKKGRR
ncbi:MAG: hypothetical protein ACK48X_02420 [Planctomycetota bacterium]